VLAALRNYFKNGRPKDKGFDHLFLRHPNRCGHPLSSGALKQMVQRAYRRCRFPKSWSGTHRLRHTFATRLHRSGADLKPIADLLGHRKLDSTTIYTSFADQTAPGQPLTIKLATLWAIRRPALPVTVANRLSAIRGFARYCASFDPRTQILPSHLTHGVGRRRAPHIFTEAQVRLTCAAPVRLAPGAPTCGL
jgi:site-specific recombinase XerD